MVNYPTDLLCFYETKDNFKLNIPIKNQEDRLSNPQ